MTRSKLVCLFKIEILIPDILYYKKICISIPLIIALQSSMASSSSSKPSADRCSHNPAEYLDFLHRKTQLYLIEGVVIDHTPNYSSYMQHDVRYHALIFAKDKFMHISMDNNLEFNKDVEFFDMLALAFESKDYTSNNALKNHDILDYPHVRLITPFPGVLKLEQACAPWREGIHYIAEPDPEIRKNLNKLIYEKRVEKIKNAAKIAADKVKPESASKKLKEAKKAKQAEARKAFLDAKKA
jgi:hypothetical protein